LPLAIALLLSLAAGRTASRIGVPRVSVYLLVGLLLGPHVGMRFAPESDVVHAVLLGPGTDAALRAVEQLAIGFILFGIGSQFHFATFRRVGPRVLTVSGMEILCTAAGAALVVGIWSGDWRLALIAPALAVSSAPSATLVTLRELEADGPASRCLLLCVGQNNLAVLLAFPLLASLAFGAGDAGAATAKALLAIAGGGMLGLVAAVWLEAITGRRELVLLGLVTVVGLLGAVQWLEPGSTALGMLACFAAGVALANGSPHSEPVFRYLENTVYPLYVLFFIGAGRDLEIGALAHAGWLGLFFISARAAGKLGGAWLGLRLSGWNQELPPSLGRGLLCQAGVALGLVGALESVAPDATRELRQVVIASVVVFELIGPWLVRRTAVSAGEVKLVNLVPHAEATGYQALRWVSLEIRRNLGLIGGGMVSGDGTRTVAHVMQRRPQTVAAGLSFERVLKALGETGAEMVPVLDGDGRFEGVISYDEVKNALYDPALRDLVIASDLATALPDPLAPDAPLAEALEHMDAMKVHSWPVVDAGLLVGVVRRSDVYRLVRRDVRRRR
jgi:Kef-type K+ transport system membrane component KefB/CBS domain-containing protein